MSKTRSTVVTGLLSAAALVVAATGGAGAGEEADIGPVVKGNTAFAVALHRRLAAEEGNLFHSPFSISTALAMTAAGARGETAKQMAEVLHLPPSEKTHVQLGALLTDLNARKLEARWREDPDAGKPAFELAIANSLWGQEGYPFVQAFLDLTRKHYGAGLQACDFKGDAAGARKRINGWVEEKTNDRIKDLLKASDVTPDLRLVLTNAIYFKAAWDEPFHESATRDAPFHLAGGTTADVPTMHKFAHLAHKDAGDLDVVKLPYQGEQASMVLLIPKKADGLAAIEASMSEKKLGAWLSGLKGTFVDLALPRFKYSSRFGMNDVLQAMGMKLPFLYPEADFKGISPTGELFIGFVIHQAFIDVNEEGTEAAAATAVGMRAGGAPPKPITIRADRPFLFLIRDEVSGSILFMGRVSDPRAS